jgi:hypothetical protein
MIFFPVKRENTIWYAVTLNLAEGMQSLNDPYRAPSCQLTYELSLAELILLIHRLFDEFLKSQPI